MIYFIHFKVIANFKQFKVLFHFPFHRIGFIKGVLFWSFLWKNFAEESFNWNPMLNIREYEMHNVKCCFLKINCTRTSEKCDWISCRWTIPYFSENPLTTIKFWTLWDRPRISVTRETQSQCCQYVSKNVLLLSQNPLTLLVVLL